MLFAKSQLGEEQVLSNARRPPSKVRKRNGCRHCVLMLLLFPANNVQLLILIEADLLSLVKTSMLCYKKMYDEVVHTHGTIVTNCSVKRTVARSGIA